jgi:carboxymethylenebutenolidase
MNLSDKTRLTAADFHPEVLRLFDQYVHGIIDRRGFLDHAARYATGGTSAVALLAALSPDFAMAQKVKPDDTRVKTERVVIDSPAGNGKINAYVARPAQAAGLLPVVVVAHENRGLNPHIEDVTRRLALEDFIAVAPDALTTLGGYPGDEDKAREAFSKLDLRKVAEDFVASAHWTRAVAGGNGKLGAVGFCYGGGVVNMLATRVPQLLAGAPFYGPGPSLDAVANIKAELCIIFADNDERINAGWPSYKDTLEVADVKFAAYKYPGTQHGFHNDTTPRFDDNAARLAWGRTLELFNRKLRA